MQQQWQTWSKSLTQDFGPEFVGRSIDKPACRRLLRQLLYTSTHRLQGEIFLTCHSAGNDSGSMKSPIQKMHTLYVIEPAKHATKSFRAKVQPSRPWDGPSGRIRHLPAKVAETGHWTQTLERSLGREAHDWHDLDIQPVVSGLWGKGLILGMKLQGAKSMQSPAVVDVTAVIDKEPFRSYQKLLVATCFILAMLDTIYLTIIGFAVPSLAASWHLKPYNFAPVIIAGVIAGALGSFVFGTVADRIGRKPTVIAGVLLFSVFTLLTPTATSLQALAIYRFLIGVGLGGMVPNAMAIAGEYSPVRIREQAVSIAACGLPVGSMMAAIMSFLMVPVLGWKSVFYVGGIVPLVILPFLVWRFPRVYSVPGTQEEECSADCAYSTHDLTFK